MFEPRPPRIAIDFDGVLHSYIQGYTGSTPLDPPVEGAVDFMWWLYDQGFEIHIFTARLSHISDLSEPHSEHYDNIVAWLRKYDFPNVSSLTGMKPAADLYIDDRGYRFTGPYGFKILKHGIGTKEFLKSWTEK